MSTGTGLKPFNMNANDIQFILAQVNFRPLFYRSAQGLAPVVNWTGVGPVYDASGVLLWDGTGMTAADALATFGSSYSSLLDISGLRYLTGQFNNLYPGQSTWGAIDQPFPRMAKGDATQYTSNDILALITTFAPSATDPTQLVRVALAPSTGSGILTDTADGPHTIQTTTATFLGHTITLSFDTFTRSTTEKQVTIVDGHHLATTSTTVSSTSTTQDFYVDASGEHVLGAAAAGPAGSSTAISGGELDASLHSALRSTNASDGFYHTVNADGSTGMVDLLNGKNYDYTVSFNATTGAAVMNSVVDYTPRMISNLIASGGVVTLKDAAGHRVDWNSAAYADNTGGYADLIDGWNATHPAGSAGYIDTSRLVEGAAIVTDWGMVGQGGGSDMQNPANGEVYIGAANPGIAATNGIFTLFGQFFDHGLDFIGKASSYKIVVPLAKDDPLYGAIGADGRPTTSITITRATVSGQDADGSATYVNHDSPYIDQNQTYGANDDVNAVLRDWVKDPNTGTWGMGARMFDGQKSVAYTDAFGNTTHDTLPTLNELRDEIAATGRTALTWEDVTSSLRHRDAQGHVGYYKTMPQLGDPNGGTSQVEVAFIGADGQAHWVDAARTGPVDTAGLHVIDTTQPLLLDMNPNFDAAHMVDLDPATAAKVTAALATLSSSPGSLGTYAMTGGQLTLTLGAALGPTMPAGTVFSGANALYGLVNFADFSISVPAGAVHDAVGELLLAAVGDHYIAGDGRANENFGLTAIHHVFHEEHNYQVQNLEIAIVKQAAAQASVEIAHGWQVAVTHEVLDAQGHAVVSALVDKSTGHYEAKDGTLLARTADGTLFVAHAGDTLAVGASLVKDIDNNTISAAGSYTLSDGTISWDENRVFLGAKLTVEMEYQHAAVDQYARAVSPNIQEFAGTSSGENAAVTLEYAQAAFRFGHSQLRETIDTMDPSHGITGAVMSYALEAAFLQPGKFANVGAGAIVLGMERQQSNEIDEFITPALQQGLLGQPLDLAAINIARGRDLNIPTLNTFRDAIGFSKYADWLDFHNNMIHPDNVVNFIAAYSLDGDVGHARAIWNAYSSAQPQTWVDGTGQHTIDATEANAWLRSDHGVDRIDLWIGGLAEVHVSGGVLGETFDAIFVAQITKLMDDDRYYYLQRLIGQQFGDEIINEQFKDIFERTTGTQHLNGNIFGYADVYYDEGRNALAADGVTELALGDAALAQAMAEQHKYGQIVDQLHIGIYSDNAATLAANGTIVHGLKAPELPSPSSGGLNGPELAGPAQVAKDYIFDGRPDLLHSTNADGTSQSGFDSSEVIVGTKYDDYIRLGPADDSAYGDDGDDVIYGGSPSTSASSGGASAGLDHLYGGAGNDTLYGEDMPDLMDGGSGDDWLFGGSSGSSINGVDQLIGSDGNDRIYGGVGIDKLYGGLGDDSIYGGDDTDPFVYGGDGNDYINGDSGQDILYGGNGSDILDGGKGIDLLYGENGDDILRPGDGESQIAGNGGGGDDLIGGDGVTDTGFDIVDYSQQSNVNGYDIDLTAQFAGQLPADLTPQPPTVTQAITTINVLFQLEGVVGSKNNDHLVGDSPADAGAAVSHGDNWLVGGSGNDLIQGNGGNDLIIGDSIKLKDLIGSFKNGYYNDSTTTVDGASHRAIGTVSGGVGDLALLTGGLIEAANGQLGGVDYEKHFTELLKSANDAEIMLGDGKAPGSLDTAVYSGNFLDYKAEKVTYTDSTGATLQVVRLTDLRAGSPDGSDLLVGVEQFQFADGVKSYAQLLNIAPTVTGTVTLAPGLEDTAVTISAAQFLANVIDPDGGPSSLSVKNVSVNPAFGSIVDNHNDTWTFTPAANFNSARGRGDVTFTYSVTDGLAVVADSAKMALQQVDDQPVGSLAIGAVMSTRNGTTAITATAAFTDVDGLPGGLGNGIAWSKTTNGSIWFNPGGAVETAGGASTLTVSTNSTSNGLYRAVSSYVDLDGNTDKVISYVGVGNTRANTLNDFGLSATLIGFDGGDTYVVGSAGTQIVETAQGTGRDEVDTTLLAYTLAANVEDLVFIGSGAFSGTGNALNNSLTGGSGNDTLDGMGGTADTVNFSGASSDYLAAFGTGAFTFSDQRANGDGSDRLMNVELVSFSDGTFNLTSVNGGNGNDFVVGTAAADTLTGGSGADVVQGGEGADSLSGGANSQSSDTLIGGGGNDTLDGGQGADQAVYHGALHDYSFSTGATVAIADSVAGRDGTDTLNSIEALRFSDGTWNLFVNNGGSTSSADVILGSANADVVSAGRGNDFVFAGGGNDTIVAGANDGSDHYDGGSGVNTYDLSATTAAATVNLGTGIASSSQTGTDVLTNIQSVIGSSANDTMTGDANANTIAGGAGNDVLTGGLGADAFVFNTTLGANNIDTVTDFTKGSDQIWLARSVFATLDGNADGAIDNANWLVNTTSGTNATLAHAEVIYDKATGNLYFDSNGTGFGGLNQFAKLQAGLTLAAADFHLF